MIISDVGRPLADLARHFADGYLLADARLVLANLVPVTREIEAENGAWYTCRILPYRTKDNRIEGVVITFVDITSRKQQEEAMLRAEKLAVAGRLAASVAHEINNPLEAVANLLYLISHAETAETARTQASSTS